MATENIGDFDMHVRLWTDMLQTFIGWSDVQVARWADWCKESSRDGNSWFYHEPPEFYVACVLTPRHLVRTIGAEQYRDLEARIQGVLKNVLVAAETIDGVDWQPAKQRIDAILNEYGESLEKVAIELADSYRDR